MESSSWERLLWRNGAKITGTAPRELRLYFAISICLGLNHNDKSGRFTNG